MAGAIALFGTHSEFSECTFEQNSSPQSVGALLATSSSVFMQNSMFDQNTGSFSNGDLTTLEAHNTTMMLPENNVTGFTTGLNIKSSLQQLTPVRRLQQTSNLTLKCPAGNRVWVDQSSSGDQYGCATCSSGSYNLQIAEWSAESLSGGSFGQGTTVKGCLACPSSNPAITECHGAAVTSQQGYYVFFVTSTELAVTSCPNAAACADTGLVVSACTSDLETCNSAYSSTAVGQNSSFLGATAAKCRLGHIGDPNPECISTSLMLAHCVVSDSLNSSNPVYPCGPS